MKKIEKQILLSDLELIKNEYLSKTNKLNMIISLYLDEKPDIAKKIVDDKVKKEEERINDINKDDINNEIDDVNNNDNDNVNIDDIETENINKDNTNNLPQDIKTIYRKIVMITHPDKNKGNDLYKEYYRKAVEAKNNNDKPELLFIAYKLNIDELYNMDEEHFGSIKRKIKEMEMISNNINYNSYWIWYHTDNQQLKRVMSSQISKKR